jgi:hypothetical protein
MPAYPKMTVDRQFSAFKNLAKLLFDVGKYFGNLHAFPQIFIFAVPLHWQFVSLKIRSKLKLI